MQGVQVFIEIQDRDIGYNNRQGAREPDELVDILVIDYNQAVRTSHRQNYTGMYGFVTMDLNITVFCVENFAEPDCSQCVPGFTGPDFYNGSECEINIDECLPNPCAPNGECIDGVHGFICNCNPGFTGELCLTNIDDCEGINCSGNGECLDEVNSFTCACGPGYSGQLCDTEGIASYIVYKNLFCLFLIVYIICDLLCKRLYIYS